MKVVWMNSDTGEIKERHSEGVEHGWWPDHASGDADGPVAGDYYENEWVQTPLELALALVPDLVDVIEWAIKDGGDVTIRASRG